MDWASRSRRTSKTLLEESQTMDTQLVRTADMIGAITANIYFVLIISVFSMRLVGRPEVGRSIRLTSFLVVVPLIYLFVNAFQTNRSHIYFLWLGLMILFLFAELLIDHVLKLEFRSVRWATILYVIFFFGATGGMIGVAGQAGKWWTTATVLTFLVMAAMAFVQRAKTGL
jgi:hypothetical protein